MRRFIVEVLVDVAPAARHPPAAGPVQGAAAVPVRSGSPRRSPTLRDAGVVGFLSWAAILVLVNRFARPVLVALTGRLLFSTMGFFVVIINAIAIWITSIIAPIKIAIVAEPTVLWIIVAAGLYTWLSTVTDAVLGLNRPDLSADRSRGIWGFLESLPTPRRNVIIENLRLQQVYNAIYSTSLDIALADTPIGSIRRWFARVVLGEQDDLVDASGPARIKAMLQQLGPTYVKIGQMMASRSDILPAEWITELSTLQSDAAPFGYDDVAEHRHQGARRAAGGAVRHVRTRTVRGRVHGPGPPGDARRTGRSWRSRSSGPGSLAKTQADLGVIQELAAVAERRLAIARKVGLSDIVGEFAAGVLKELDYRNEAYHARRLADGMTRFPQVHVPIVYDDLSGQRVITMEFVNGHQDLEGGRAARRGLRHDRARDRVHPRDHQASPRRRLLPRRPAPRQRPGRPESQQIVFLDLGLVGQLNADQRMDLLGLIYAIKEIDIPGIGDGLIALGKPTPTFDEAGFRADIDRLAHQYLIYGKATLARGRAGRLPRAPCSTTACGSTAS